MAKLNACSSSIHVTPSGNGLPSAWSHVGRLVDGTSTEGAASAGSLGWTSRFESFTGVSFFIRVHLPCPYPPAQDQRKLAAPSRFTCALPDVAELIERGSLDRILL